MTAATPRAAAGLAEALAEVLGRQWDVDVAVDGLRQLSGGASRETWAFRATPARGAAQALVLQRERAGGLRDAAGLAHEAQLVRAAAAAGVPVPELVVADGDPAAADHRLGLPWLVARHVEGETIPRRILRDDAYRSARPLLAGHCGRALAAVHRIPPTAADGLESHEPVDRYRRLLDELGQPHPAFELGLRWLDGHRPLPVDEVVVHGDFRNGNIVVGASGLQAVLDWELAHLGDPAEDLAWLCLRSWRFGSDLPVGGFGHRHELLDAYRDAGGPEVLSDRLHWWEVMGTLRWGVFCIMQTTAHRTGLSRSVELAAIGRRVCETERDLLELLG
ncbi:MAG: phosphotransferase family protein [Acidimicrobiales bacterium]